MIKLYQFPPCWDIPNASPFCAKLETYLRMTKLPFQVKKMLDPRKAPKGKLPYIDDEGECIADSSLIIDYLKSKYGDSLDAGLTSEQRANAICIQRMLEDHLYWCMLYSRWIDSENWPQTKKTLFAKVPWLIRNFIANSVQKSTRKDLHSVGIGRHTQEEIYQLGILDLTALHVNLVQHPFLLGDVATSIDACAYGFLVNIIYVPTNSPMKDFAKAQPAFTNYCERMKALYY